MIPDKIYINTATVPSNIQGEDYALPGWHEKPNPKTANVEYIRKDALLEWAKEKIAKGTIDEWDKGYVQCLNDLIDKLNSI